MSAEKKTSHERQVVRDEWAAFIERFQGTDPKKISFQCILEHTQKISNQLRESALEIAPAVEAGVIPVLLRILGHHDVRSDAELQRLALKTLIFILENGGHGNYDSLVVEAGGIPRLLRLLKLRRDAFADDVLYVLDLLTNHVQCDLIPDEESADCLIEGLYTSNRDTRRGILLYIQANLPQFVQKLVSIPHRIADIVSLFTVENADILELLSETLQATAENESRNVWHELTSSGFLQKFKDIICSIYSDGEEDAVIQVRETFGFIDLLKIVKRYTLQNSYHALEVSRSGFLDCLYLLLNPVYADTDEYALAHCILAHVKKAEKSLLSGRLAMGARC